VINQLTYKLGDLALSFDPTSHIYAASINAALICHVMIIFFPQTYVSVISIPESRERGSWGLVSRGSDPERTQVGPVQFFL